MNHVIEQARVGGVVAYLRCRYCPKRWSPRSSVEGLERLACPGRCP